MNLRIVEFFNEFIKIIILVLALILFGAVFIFVVVGGVQLGFFMLNKVSMLFG